MGGGERLTINRTMRHGPVQRKRSSFMWELINMYTVLHATCLSVLASSSSRALKSLFFDLCLNSEPACFCCFFFFHCWKSERDAALLLQLCNVSIQLSQTSIRQLYVAVGIGKAQVSVRGGQMRWSREKG